MYVIGGSPDIRNRLRTLLVSEITDCRAEEERRTISLGGDGKVATLRQQFDLLWFCGAGDEAAQGQGVIA